MKGKEKIEYNSLPFLLENRKLWSVIRFFYYVHLYKYFINFPNTKKKKAEENRRYYMYFL